MSKTSTLPLFDGHNNSLLSLDGGEAHSFFEKSEQGDLELPRARQGNLAGGLYAIFFEHEHQDHDDTPAVEALTSHSPELGYAQQLTISALASLFRLEAESEGQLQVVWTADQLSTCLENGILATLPRFEGAVVPRGLGDAAGLPKLQTALRARGYGEVDLVKITRQNWLRICHQTW